MMNVKDFGAIGNGTADDTDAVQDALNAAGAAGGGVVYVPRGTYKMTSHVAIPSYVTLSGEQRYATTLLQGAAIDLLEVGEASAIEHITLYGNASYANKSGLLFYGNGRQRVTDTNILNFDGPCVKFTTSAAGGQCCFIDCQLKSADPDEYAVVIPDSYIETANPRKFFAIETNGGRFISLRGANDLMIVGSVVGGLLYSTNSRAVFISASRLLNEPEIEIQGANHTIVGCNILAQITIASGVDNCAVYANSHNAMPGVIDASGNNLNSIDPRALSPTLQTNGVIQVAYSSSITPAATDPVQIISANNNSAFTINAPTSPSKGTSLMIMIRNTSAGALGGTTWNAIYKMAAWTQPANDFSRSITFVFDGTSWIERARTPSDVPN